MAQIFLLLIPMKFLLINPPLENIDPERVSAFPLGLAYIGRVISNAGHKVEVLDIQLNGYSRDEAEKRIKSVKADFVLLTGLVTTFSYIVWLAEIIKKYHPREPLVMGGALATTAPKILMENTRVDIAVIDEGELTVAELVKVFEGKKKPEGVKGIWHKNAQGAIFQNPPRERIKNLDSIDFPLWKIFDMEKYLNLPVPMFVPAFRKKKRWIYISTSRGCPFECRFCSKVFGRVVHLRSAENIIEEIKFLVDRYGLEHVNFCDDLFMVNRARVSRLCELFKKLDKKVTWSASSRVDTIDEKILKEMKEAGCISLGLGVESGSQKILDNMNKKITSAIAKKAIAMIKKAGIYPHCSFMIGMVGENDATAKETFDFIKEIDTFPQGLAYTTALPGSKLYEESLAKGIIKDEGEYLRKMTGNFIEHYVLNFSEIPGDGIVSLKQKYDRELRLNYMLHHPVWTMKSVAGHLKFYGARDSIKRFKKKIYR